MRAPLKLAAKTGELLTKLRKEVSGVGSDCFLAPELEVAERLLANEVGLGKI